MFVVNVFEVWEGEFLFEEGGKFFLDGLSPMAHENDELVDVPSNTASGYLGVVAFEFGGFMLSLGTEIFFCPNLAMQMRIVDEGHAFFGGFFHLLGGEFLFANAKEIVFFGIVPKDTHAWHLLVKGAHIVHLRLSIFIV